MSGGFHRRVTRAASSERHSGGGWWPAAAVGGKAREPDDAELALSSRPVHRVELSANPTAENARGIAVLPSRLSHPRYLTCSATSSPGVASPLTSGRVRKRGGGAGGPRAAQGRARVPTKTQAGAAAPDGRPPAAAVRGVQLPLAALHDGSLPQGQRLPAREVRAALPSHPPPPPSMPTCGLTHAVLGVRPLPSGWRPAAPDVTLPPPARAGSTSRRASTCSTATTTRTSASAELRLSGDR